MSGPPGTIRVTTARRRVRRNRTLLAAVLLVLLAGAGLRYLGPGRSPAAAEAGPRVDAPAGTAGALGPTPTRPAVKGRPVTVRLAFAGDVHFAGTSAAALTLGLGTGAAPLASADLAVVNLETAITGGGVRAPKQYTFRAPPQSLQVLRAAGIDAVSLANNHGLDFGDAGLADTLAASLTYRLPVIGAGVDAAAAFHGLVRTVRGVRVAIVSATDVLDSATAADWTAGPDHPGLASAKDGDLLTERLRQLSAQADVVVAFLHWGAETRACPTQRQEDLAQALVAAGADVVVGSHAHVLQPLAHIGAVPVAYGLGNFVFYARKAPATSSGVLLVDVAAVPGSGPAGTPVATPRWQPATIVQGRPAAVEPSPTTDLPALEDC